MTLPSISSETWVIESSCDLGTFEFYAKLLPGFSSQFSLFKAASFFLFRVAISTEKRILRDKQMIVISWKENQVGVNIFQ